MSDFPHRYARSRRFTVGMPRSIAVAGEGATVLFLRAPGGDRAANALVALDVASGVTRVVVDPDVLLGAGGEDLPPEELARRERARDSGSGIVGFDADDGGCHATFTLSGRLFVVEVATGEVAEWPAVPGAFDPRMSPDGAAVAYVADGALHVVTAQRDHLLASDEDPDVRWGVADFAAAEEMHRFRGFWWSPDGDAILAARVDESPVARWYIADPAHPASTPVAIRYPSAGTDNADVSLHILRLDGAQVALDWDAERFPYLARVSWPREPGPTLLVQSRDQRSATILTASPTTGATTVARELVGDPWVELCEGWPAWTGSAQLVTVEDVERDGALVRSVLLDGVPISTPDLHVRDVVAVEADRVTWVAWVGPSDTVVQQWRDGVVTDLSERTGVNTAVTSHGTTVNLTTSLSAPIARCVHRDGVPTATIDCNAEAPGSDLNMRWTDLGPDRLRAALLLPTEPGTGPLPVVLSPYGGPGPGAQRVQSNSALFLVNQWIADQGFAVLVVDGSGMSGRGPAWEHRVHRDFTRTLDDQIAALHAAAAIEPRLDLTRVAMRGWSFGGYLSALAVLRRPDVFRAGVAGAPVTDWHLYDTHYTERYLGHPDASPEVYRTNSLVDLDGSLVDAAPWGDDPPALLIVQGLADDNVVAAHALRLSHALLADGRPHSFLPLTGVTHMTPQVVVAENLLHNEVAFLRAALG